MSNIQEPFTRERNTQLRIYRGEMSMLDKIPNAEEMTALVGQSLYDVWNELSTLIDEKYEMECLWNKVVKHGNMNINTVEVAKHYVHYMQEKTVWDL